MNQAKERVFVIQPIESENYRVLQEEAVALIESANADYAGTVYQKIREVNPATYIGEGKAEEIREMLLGLDVTVLFNGELSPSQTLNLSAALEGRKVIDRTTLILDIFALRAESSEGKIQVELAQLKYLYPRLRGKGEALSRLGGGIGTRGPGETQLETEILPRARLRSMVSPSSSSIRSVSFKACLIISLKRSNRRWKARCGAILLSLSAMPQASTNWRKTRRCGRCRIWDFRRPILSFTISAISFPIFPPSRMTESPFRQNTGSGSTHFGQKYLRCFKSILSAVGLQCRMLFSPSITKFVRISRSAQQNIRTTGCRSAPSSLLFICQKS